MTKHQSDSFAAKRFDRASADGGMSQKVLGSYPPDPACTAALLGDTGQKWDIPKA